MKQYQDLIKDIFENGYETDDRTGTGTIALFGTKLRWDLTKGFPAVTTKKLAWKACIAELIWFLSGSTNVNDLRLIQHDSLIQGKTVWDENYENQAKDLGYNSGELGPIYGKQWRDFGGVDQIIEVIDRIKNMPMIGVKLFLHGIQLNSSRWHYRLVICSINLMCVMAIWIYSGIKEVLTCSWACHSTLHHMLR